MSQAMRPATSSVKIGRRPFPQRYGDGFHLYALGRRLYPRGLRNANARAGGLSDAPHVDDPHVSDDAIERNVAGAANDELRCTVAEERIDLVVVHVVGHRLVGIDGTAMDEQELAAVFQRKAHLGRQT